MLCVALAAAMALVPWQRIGQGWQLAPPLLGATLRGEDVLAQVGGDC